MKPIDKLEGNILISYNNITGLIDEIHFKPYTDKLNQLISSHNKLMKIIEDIEADQDRLFQRLIHHTSGSLCDDIVNKDCIPPLKQDYNKSLLEHLQKILDFQMEVIKKYSFISKYARGNKLKEKPRPQK